MTKNGNHTINGNLISQSTIVYLEERRVHRNSDRIKFKSSDGQKTLSEERRELKLERLSLEPDRLKFEYDESKVLEG